MLLIIFGDIMAVDQLISITYNIGMALFGLIVSLFFALGSVYIGIKMFDRFTTNIDEWEEIKKGNVAVGILLAAVIISIGTVIQTGVVALTNSLNVSLSMTQLIVNVLIALFNLLIALFAAILSIYIAIRVLDKITVDIDEMKELKKKNVAVAIIMAGVLITVSFVISSGVTAFTSALNAGTIAAIFS